MRNYSQKFLIGPLAAPPNSFHSFMAVREISRNRRTLEMQQDDQQLGFELGGDDQASGQPNLREIREDLDTILEEARNVSAGGPWDMNDLRYKKIVFMQLVKLLPDSEGEQLSFDFLGEYERIEALLAA